jgi:hypothetical protein
VVNMLSIARSAPGSAPIASLAVRFGSANDGSASPQAGSGKSGRVAGTVYSIPAARPKPPATSRGVLSAGGAIASRLSAGNVVQ